MNSKELCLVHGNHATVTLNQEVAFRFHSQSRIKLQTPQILKKMLEKSSPFLSSEQPCELKILDIALNIAGVKKIRSTLEVIWFEFWMKRALVMVEIYIFCGRRFSNQFNTV